MKEETEAQSQLFTLCRTTCLEYSGTTFWNILETFAIYKLLCLLGPNASHQSFKSVPAPSEYECCLGEGECSPG